MEKVRNVKSVGSVRSVGSVGSKKNIFINEYRVNSLFEDNKLNSIYTNFIDKKSLRITNKFNEFLSDEFINKLNLVFDNLQQEINAVKELIKIKNIGVKYVLYTGQSLTDYLKWENDTRFDVNDLDFFVFTIGNEMSNNSEDQIFETPRSVSEYDDLTSTNYGYYIKKSEKINIKVERSGEYVGTFENRVLNLVMYSDMFAEYEFKELGYKNRVLNSCLSTLNFFDLNMVQHGFLIDLENMTFDYIFTKEFFEFFKLRQISLNKKRVSYRSLERLKTKYLNLKKRRFNHFLDDAEWLMEGDERYFINENYKLFFYAFNKLNEKFLEVLEDKKDGNGRIDFSIHWDLLNAYKNLVSFQNFIKPITVGIGIDNPLFKNDSYAKYLCSMHNVKMHKNVILNVVLNTFDERKIDYMHFDYVHADLPKEIINNFDYLIDLFGGYESILFKDVKYFELINIIMHLSFLSHKKIKKLVTFCERNNLGVLDILFWIEQDPKILNMDLNKIKKVYKYIKGHGLYLFEIPFKFSINPSLLFEIFYNFINILESKVKELKESDEDLKVSDINSMDIIGSIESGDLEFWPKIFSFKNIDEINNFFIYEIDKHFAKIKEEIIKDKKPFHLFNKIEVKLDDVYGTELTSNFNLKKEGKKMNHCVGGFGNLCKKGKTIIFKIHSKQDDDFRYTIEFKPIIKKDTEELIFHVMQIRGKSNKSVPMEHRKQVDEIIKEVTEKLKTRESYYKKLILNEKKEYKQPIFFN